MIDFEKLYAPYSAKASLDETLSWLSAQAAMLKISDDVVQLVVSETFLEMASGKTFSTTGGDTGFTGFPHAELNHYMLNKLRIRQSELSNTKRIMLENALKDAITQHITPLPEIVDALPTVDPVRELSKKETGFFNLKASPILRVLGYGS